MTIGSKFNVGLSNITIDRLTLLSYKIKLDDYIKKNNLWDDGYIAVIPKNPEEPWNKE